MRPHKGGHARRGAGIAHAHGIRYFKTFDGTPGEVFSPNQIYEQVWRDNPYGTENTVAVHIRHLREKVEYNPAEPRYLKVVWGRGYKMEETV